MVCTSEAILYHCSISVMTFIIKISFYYRVLLVSLELVGWHQMVSSREFRLLNRCERSLTTPLGAASAAGPFSKGTEQGWGCPSRTDRFSGLKTCGGTNPPPYVWSCSVQVTGRSVINWTENLVPCSCLEGGAHEHA